MQAHAVARQVKPRVHVGLGLVLAGKTHQAGVTLHGGRVQHAGGGAGNIAALHFCNTVLGRHLLVAEAGMHEGGMGDVDAVLHHPVHRCLPGELGFDRAPLIAVVKLRKGRDGVALGLGEIAHENPDHAVALLGRVGIDAGALGDLGALPPRGNELHLALGVEFPAVVGAGHAVALGGPTARQGAPAVNTNITEAINLARLVAKQHEVLAQQPRLHRFVLDRP